MTRELTGVLAHEIIHIAKHDVGLMQLAGIVGQMTRVIAQVAVIIAAVTWLLDIFGSGEGVDGLALGALVAAPIAANLILGALSRLREYQADLEAVALTGDPAGLARALELIGMAQAGSRPARSRGRSASGCRACCRRIQIPRIGSAGFAIWRSRKGRRVRTSASPYRTISRTSGSGGSRLPSDLGAGCHRLDGSIGGTTTFGSRDDDARGAARILRVGTDR
jgi:Zn-dependent protease with chaperone function